MSVNQKVQLVDDGKNLFPLATLNGIDASNVIAQSIPFPYTAQEECYVLYYYDGNVHVYIDGELLDFSAISGWHYNLCPMKKGQILTADGRANAYRVYGVKR
ncbi:MAG: hypothetical protein KBT03_06915 [Bacteroidales bacterium]|nr:hypothetical protein [Candidatus Scybalousia scybalohippi]